MLVHWHSPTKALPFSPPSLHSDMAQTLLLLYKETVQIHGPHLHSVDENYLPPRVITEKISMNV